MRLRRFLYRLLTVLILICAIVGTVYYLLTEYRVEKIRFQGLEFGSENDIRTLISEGYLGDNSLYLTRKFKETPIDTIPFVDAIDIKADSHKEITVYVYEKIIVGCVELSGRYYFFDKDGFVADTMSDSREDVVLVTGLNLDYINKGEKLPIDNPKVFEGILNVAKLLEKYGLDADQLYVKKDDSIVVYFGNVRIDFGNRYDNIEDKFTLIDQFLNMLEGESGVLNMAGDTDTFVFTKDDEKLAELPTEGELG